MLILTRKLGETITIGDDVTVTVLEIKGGQIKLGVEAPRSLPVHRGEVYRAITEQNQQAVVTMAPAAIWQFVHRGKDT